MTRARLLVGLAILGAARAAFAGGFESDQFHPSDTSNGYFSVDGAQPVRHLGYSAGLYLNYGHDVLVLRDTSGHIPPGGELISQQLGLDLVGSFGLLGRLELGIDLPLVLYQAVDNTLAQLPGGIATGGAGDLRIDLKVLIHKLTIAGHTLAFAGVAGLRLPTGDSASFLGQDGVSGFPRLVAEWSWWRLAVAINFGAVLRSTRSYQDLYVTHQIAYGLGARFEVAHGLSVQGELSGLVGVGFPSGSSLQTSEAPAEVALGVRWRSRFGLEASLAGGAGLSRGYGTPDGRFIVGARYQAPDRRRVGPLDTDHDGVPDAQDRCPTQAGVAENDGCPELDTDGDGVVDSRDHCRDRRGPAENAGCPDEDSDGDGVVDRLDGCPMTKGVAANHGCPDSADQDQDGVPDSRDRCPTQVGVPENDGCPDIDSDGDGIVDRLDKCPFDAEVFNGNADEDGCPDAGPVLAELGAERIVLKEKPLFVGNAVDKRSYKAIGVVATLLKLHPEILKLRIEGHTDNRGSAIDNLDLSRVRAASVRRVLIEQFGIDGRRLVAQGFGPDRPIADNKDPIARLRNNRIDLVIIDKHEGP